MDASLDMTNKPLKIYCNNKFIILFSKNNKSISGFEYVEIRYFKIKDFVKNCDVVVEHIDTNMIAPLVEGLRPIVFNRCVESIGVLGSFDVLS